MKSIALNHSGAGRRLEPALERRPVVEDRDARAALADGPLSVVLGRPSLAESAAGIAEAKAGA